VIDALVLLVALLLKSTFVAAAAALLVAALKVLRVSAAARHFVWLLAFAAIALLPLLSLVLPQLIFAIPYSAFGAVGPDLSSPGEHLPDRAGMALVWCVYMLGAAVLLARLATARLALSALWRRARPHIGLASELSQACGVRGAVTVRVADQAVAPMTWGRRVLLPQDAVTWPAARERGVLVHELSHVARRDSLTQLSAAIVRAFFWFSPAVWFALRALRLEQEHACDERVLGAGVGAAEYAETLLEVAIGVRQPPVGMGVSSAMVRRSDLERRVVAVLAPLRARSLGAGGAVALCAVLLASSALIAAVRPVDSARVLGPLAPLSTTLDPLSARLAPLPRLTGRISLPDEPSSDDAR
jgi:beta-lactamase regulating signal transducer with metallopeptidase domain